MGKLVGNYRVNDKQTAIGTSTITFVGPEVPHGQTAILTYMAVTDYTTDSKKLVLGIRPPSGVDHYVMVNQGTGVEEVYTARMQGELVLLPGDKAIGIVESPTNADVCYFTAHGGLYLLEEGGAA